MFDVKVVDVHNLYPFVREERVAFYLNQGYTLVAVDEGSAYLIREIEEVVEQAEETE